MWTSGLATVFAVFAVLAVSAVGCGPVIAGTARPAPNLKPKPLSGRVVAKVLLDGRALSRMLGQPFVSRAPAAGTANPDLSAVDVVQAMMEKVSDLS